MTIQKLSDGTYRRKQKDAPKIIWQLYRTHKGREIITGNFTEEKFARNYKRSTSEGKLSGLRKVPYTSGMKIIR